MEPSELEPRAAESLLSDELVEAWPALSGDERLEGFRLLTPVEAEDLYLGLEARDQVSLLLALPSGERQIWIRQLPPDDAADVLQEAPGEERARLLDLIDPDTRREVTALLAYAEDEAGGLMSPRYARLRPEMRVDEAISYLRRQARQRLETIYYIYVLDAEQHLLGVVSFRELFAAPPDKTVRDVMRTDVVSVPDDMDQEAVSDLIAQHDLMAVPVVDAEGRIKGIVTIDDIVDVVREEATEDIQKIGGTAALDAPYLQVSILEMVRKRVGWLAVLFVGSLLTATVISSFEDQIARAVVLALFIPLIISSGGNTGSQATTLVIRALAIGEVRPRDWLLVFWREVQAGLALGAILGLIGFARVTLFPPSETGTSTELIAAVVAVSLVGIVLWGSLVGAMLPFVLRRLGFDPASASAPFVATLVDVTGLVIYFSVATLFLRGTLL
ncbi:MAG: magnesium transporter [Deltaproteobacteria bacterium]|nr:magnesium transporter [Deltaproteobacteria bacterium]